MKSTITIVGVLLLGMLTACSPDGSPPQSTTSASASESVAPVIPEVVGKTVSQAIAILNREQIAYSVVDPKGSKFTSQIPGDERIVDQNLLLGTSDSSEDVLVISVNLALDEFMAAEALKEAEESAKAEASAKAATEAEASAKAATEAEAVAKAAAKAEASAKAAAADELSAKIAAGTVSQRNALRKASDYIKYSAFSRTGLIGQLEYEKFSTEDAAWAVENLSVDWNVQAAEKAKDYLEYSGFSRSGLFDQLVYEGFTSEQAEYGVSQTGL